MSEYVFYIGYVAAACTSMSFLPQAIKVIKTNDTESLSIGMYSVFTFGVLCWLLYGVVLMDWPMIIANVITFTLAGIILALKVKHTFFAKKITETP
ncbi:MAG: glutathione synthetase [Alteromonadaceae bacterium]|nr:glutathione synthetase [Alteromonadaceae bacterium]